MQPVDKHVPVRSALGDGGPLAALGRRAIDSETLRRSPRLRILLEHLCERTVSGHPEELTEPQIGVAVFDRPPGYDSANDNVVRVAARQLRLKLKQYFETEAADSPEILVIPKGSYVPQILPRSPGFPAEREEVAPVAPASPPSAPGGRRWKWSLLVAACVLALMVVAFALRSSWKNKDLTLSRDLREPSLDLVKSTVLVPGQRTLAIVGDADLAMLSERAGVTLSLKDYMASGRNSLIATLPKEEKSFWESGLSRMHVDRASLAAVVRILQLDSQAPDQMLVQHAAEVRASDIGNGNLLLIGDPVGNPWMELITPDLNFQVFFDNVKHVMAVRNREPKAGEAPQYSYTSTSNRSQGFAVIAMKANPVGTGKALVLSGTDPEAVAAAVAFVTDHESVPRLCAVAGVSNPQELDAFELLLRVNSIKGLSGVAEVLSSRQTRRGSIVPPKPAQ